MAPIYLVLALATGGAAADRRCWPLFGYRRCAGPPRPALLALAAGWALKSRYWSAIDSDAKSYTAEAAIGLGQFGTVRPLDPPHTQPNFVMREMGYKVARRHAEKLRRIAGILLFALPLAVGLLLSLGLPGIPPIALAALAVLSATAGVLVERWLFFAEAEHVVMLYYRGGTA